MSVIENSGFAFLISSRLALLKNMNADMAFFGACGSLRLRFLFLAASSSSSPSSPRLRRAAGALALAFLRRLGRSSSSSKSSSSSPSLDSLSSSLFFSSGLKSSSSDSSSSRPSAIMRRRRSASSSSSSSPRSSCAPSWCRFLMRTFCFCRNSSSGRYSSFSSWLKLMTRSRSAPGAALSVSVMSKVRSPILASPFWSSTDCSSLKRTMSVGLWMNTKLRSSTKSRPVFVLCAHCRHCRSRALR
mmetsp:Transcript_13996/g.41730  ORF Transcript_13996/g.41730 Transcript_13996/m.41730 type:complete len:244 (-) Transcript_13996:1155-1886(-)